MGLFDHKENNGMEMIFGPDGQSHLAFKAGGNTFVDGQMYTQVGDNFAVGTDGKTYFQSGNVIFGSDGQTHLKFGDNPTFLM